MGETARALERMDEAWGPLRGAADSLAPGGLEQLTAAGWTAKELLSHVAFWDEAALPVILYMLRGQDIPEGHYFGSGYRADSNVWPSADVHNAREAGWGREHSADEVVARLLRAHGSLVETVASLSDEEAAAHGGYLGDHCDHYREHAAELQGLLG